LAKELGVPNVDRMLRGMSGLQLVEWMEYARLEPFGEERADARDAIQTAALGNIMIKLWTGEDGELEAKDFMPQFEAADADKQDVANKVDLFFSMLAEVNNQ